MKYTLPLLVFTLFLISATAQDAVQKANAEAIRIYPALAQKDSPLNKAFIALYAQAKQSNPKLLAAPDWPLTLAGQAAASLGVAPNVAQPAVQAVEEPKAVPDALVGDKQKVEKPAVILIISNMKVRQKIDGLLLLEVNRQVRDVRYALPPPTEALIEEGKKAMEFGAPWTIGVHDVDGKNPQCILREHPYYKEYVDQDFVQCLCVEDGNVEIGGSTYHAYRYIPVPAHKPVPTQDNPLPKAKPKLKPVQGILNIEIIQALKTGVLVRCFESPPDNPNGKLVPTGDPIFLEGYSGGIKGALREMEWENE